MNTPTEVRKTLQRIANMVMNDTIDCKKANTIIFACNSVLNSIRTDEMQKNIDEIYGLIEDMSSQNEIGENR